MALVHYILHPCTTFVVLHNLSAWGSILPMAANWPVQNIEDDDIVVMYDVNLSFGLMENMPLGY
jgi:hypothetical protein